MANDNATGRIRNEIRAIEADLQDPRFVGEGRRAAMRLLNQKVSALGASMGLR